MSLQKMLRTAQASLASRQWKPDPTLLQCPQIPLPMHGVAPRTVLGSVWWDATRNNAYKSTNWHCAACGVHKSDALYHKWLEGHELYEIKYEIGWMTYLRTVPLCHYCHNYIHNGRMKALLDIGKLHHAKYAAIIQHGDKVLAAAGLSRLPVYNGKCAPWSMWRLLVNGGSYPPKYSCLDEYVKAMGVLNQ